MSANPQFRFNPLTGKLDLSDIGGGGGGVPYPGGVVAWTDITTATQAIAADNGYTASNDVDKIIFTLPAVIAYGKIIRIVGNGLALWRIAQRAGQQIHFGAIDTTVGTSGYIESSGTYDAVELLCVVPNTEFTVINGPQGILNYN